MTSRWPRSAKPTRRNLRRAAPAEVSLWGNLLVTAATAAARAGDDSEATDLLAVAHGAAVRLGEPRNDYQTAFGVEQVVMQRIDVAVVAGDYVRALDTAADMPPMSTLPLAAQARHRTDLAHAHASLGRYAEAERLLLEIERMAPRWMRYQVFPRVVIGELLSARRPSTSRLCLLCRADWVSSTTFRPTSRRRARSKIGRHVRSFL